MESPWSALSGKNKGRHGVGQSVGAAEEVCRTGSWAGIQMREGRGEDLRDKGYTGVSGGERLEGTPRILYGRAEWGGEGWW